MSGSQILYFIVLLCLKNPNCIIIHLDFLQLTELYRNSLVGDSFERLEIEAFSKGSILVDYYVSFKEFEGQVTTSVLKEVLNQQFEGQDGSSKLGRFTIDPNFTDFYGKDQT